MFKNSFKYYKAKQSEPDFENVIDVQNKNVDKIKEHSLGNNWEETFVPLGMEKTVRWCLYTFMEHPGLIMLRGVFNVNGQRYWMARCLKDYPKPPNRINLNHQHYTSNILEDWWSSVQNCGNAKEMQKLKTAVRWTTLGFHHNWDSKIYNYEQCSEFPKDLNKMCSFIANILGFKQFKCQAAIINYYPLGATLAGHVDKSEQNLEAPLFSFSFGQKAVFLIGGPTDDIKPSAIYLESGDILVMSKESRMCYHAVPRIMKDKLEKWNHTVNCMNSMRTEDFFHSSKDIYKYKDILTWSMDPILYKDVMNDTFWLPYNNYFNNSRVNINIRQVQLQ